ncbi:MAG TPA: sugar phosphate isomerase/epimerase, partial [Candidatus Dormibacteraeota bacterium]|nr:sugar phosphate isomerase/epimerase [Candidatus Dormibacteraeota bacterium]
KELKRSGLIACAAHVSLDRVTGDLERVLAECRDWGCEYVVIPSLPNEYRSSDGYKRFATEATALAEPLRAKSLQLAYHNHAYELERYGEQTGLEILLSGAIVAELDTYWLQFGGANPAEWIRRCASRAPLVHLKDMAIDHGRQVDAEVGEGNLNWLDILSACREAGTRWLVVEQDAPRRDSLESVAISYAYLTQLMRQVGLEG